MPAELENSEITQPNYTCIIGQFGDNSDRLPAELGNREIIRVAYAGRTMQSQCKQLCEPEITRAYYICRTVQSRDNSDRLNL